MTDGEQKEKLRQIEEALRVFPQIVKQNAARGKAHRELMKRFEPMMKEVRRLHAEKRRSTEQ